MFDLIKRKLAESKGGRGMDLLKCRALVRAIELGSFSAAAAEMGYTPSGISHMAAAVEDELGVVLLRRGRSGVSLSPPGEMLLPALRDLVRADDRLRQQVMDCKGLVTGKVTLGVYASMASQWLPRVLRDFHRDYPGVRLQLMEGTHQELEDWMSSSRLDFCVFSRKEGFAGTWIPLYRDEMLAALPPDHPLTALKAVPLKALEGLPFIMSGGGHDFDVVAPLQKAGVQLDVRYSTIEGQALLSMVECGLGVGVLNSLCTQGREWKLALRPLDPPQFAEMGVAAPQLEEVSPAARKLIRYIRRALTAPRSGRG